MKAGRLAPVDTSRVAALGAAADPFRRPAMVTGLAFVILLGATPFGEVQPRIQLIMVILGAVVCWMAFRNVRRVADRVDRLALLAYLLFLVPVVFSNFARQSVDIALSGLAVLALFVVSRRELADRMSRRFVLGLFTLIALGVGGLALLSWGEVWVGWVTHFGSLPPELPLPGFVFGNVHDIAILVVLCTPAVLIEPSGWRRVAAPLAVFVAVAVVVIDGSRNVLLAMGIATAIVGGVALSRANRRWRTTFVVGAVGILIAATVVAALTGLLARLVTPDTLGIRLSLWSASVEIWLSDPLFGQGLGTFPWLLQQSDYFAERAFAPRHPDNAIFQLLAEAGIVGLVGCAVAAIAIAVGARAVRPPLPAVWALLFYAACGLLANPTDFGFLIVPAVLWAGLCTRTPERAQALPDPPTMGRAWLVSAATATFGLLALAIALSVPVAGMVHERSSGHGEVENALAEADLRLAMQIDPGLALYYRELGAVIADAGDPSVVLPVLERAVALNPSDTAAYRLLALTAQQVGDEQRALQAAETAVDQKENEVANLLTLAQIHAAQGSSVMASAIVAEVVSRAPWVTGAMDLGAMGLDLTTAAALDDSIALWQRGKPTKVEYQFEPMWLVALDGDQGLLSAAAAETVNSPQTARSLYALLDCEISQARELLESAQGAEGGSAWYWIVRYMLETVEGNVSPETEWFVGYLGLQNPVLEGGTSATALYNGLADPWGYGQWPLNLPRRAELAPTEGAGLSEWTHDPIRAAKLAVPNRPLADCDTGGPA